MISKDVYVLSKKDLFKIMELAYKDAMNRNSLDCVGIINEVVN